MNKEKKQFHDSSIIVDNDIEIIGEEKFNGTPIMRMNIDTGEISFLLSYLENINNTLKDKPNMKSNQHDDHGYCRIDKNGNQTIPTLKEDVDSALDMVRDMYDIISPLSLNYYFPNGYKNSSTYKRVKKIIELNNEKRGVLPL